MTARKSVICMTMKMIGRAGNTLPVLRQLIYHKKICRNFVKLEEPTPGHESITDSYQNTAFLYYQNKKGGFILWIRKHLATMDGL